MTKEQLDDIEARLQENLLRLCLSFGMTGDVLLSSDDIDGKWKEFAPEFMADAVKNFNSYPEFTLACAAFAGMAVAKFWDEDWGRHHGEPYSVLLGSRGFDNMDDHIVADILGYEPGSAEAGALVSFMECLSQSAWDFIRHSAIEAGTADAFHMLARAARVMFRTGAGIELKRLGYRFQQVMTNRFS